MVSSKESIEKITKCVYGRDGESGLLYFYDFLKVNEDLTKIYILLIQNSDFKNIGNIKFFDFIRILKNKYNFNEEEAKVLFEEFSENHETLDYLNFICFFKVKEIENS